jgi:hypothetical protein
MTSPHDDLRLALQKLLNDAGDGWMVRDYVVILGLEKISSAGKLESAAWMAAPGDQPDYVTDGLIASAEDMRANADIEDD